MQAFSTSTSRQVWQARSKTSQNGKVIMITEEKQQQYSQVTRNDLWEVEDHKTSPLNVGSSTRIKSTVRHNVHRKVLNASLNTNRLIMRHIVKLWSIWKSTNRKRYLSPPRTNVTRCRLTVWADLSHHHYKRRNKKIHVAGQTGSHTEEKTIKTTTFKAQWYRQVEVIGIKGYKHR